jgi:integrase
MTTRPPKRPEVLAVGRTRARAIRGPREDGRWYWRAERLEGDTRSTVWTGWGTESEVERELAHQIAQAHETRGADPSEVRTVFDLLDVWVAANKDRTDVKERTKVVYRCSANRITKSKLALPDTRLDRLDRRALEAYRDARIRSGGAPLTVSQELIALGQAWRWARDIGAGPDRDYPRVSVKAPRVERNVPNSDTISAVLALLEAHAPAWIGLALRLLAATGARRTEIAQLRWRDVEVERDATGRPQRTTLRLDGKTGVRRVPLHPSLADHLDTWRPEDVHPSALVLGVSIKTVQVNLLERVKWACDRLGIPAFRLHDIRASVVATLYRSGTDPGTAAALAGHSPTTALAYYHRATADDLRAAVERAQLGVLTADNVIPMRRR